MCEHRCVAEQLMKNIWLRSVERCGVVAHVLCGAEDSEAERVEELALGQKPADWLQSPSGSLLQVR